MSNSEALKNLDRLKAMAKKKPGTSGFSRENLAAIQMAVDVLELIIDADRCHSGDLEMHDVDSEETPKMLCVGGSEEYYGETCFECFINGAAILAEVSGTST
jgi:hypothetical protein